MPGGQSARTGGCLQRVRQAHLGAGHRWHRWVSQVVRRVRASSSKGRQPRYSRIRWSCSVSVANRLGDFLQQHQGQAQLLGQMIGHRRRGPGTLPGESGHRPAACRAGRHSGAGSLSPRHRRTSTRSRAESVQHWSNSSGLGSSGKMRDGETTVDRHARSPLGIDSASSVLAENYSFVPEQEATQKP